MFNRDIHLIFLDCASPACQGNACVAVVSFTAYDDVYLIFLVPLLTAMSTRRSGRLQGLAAVQTVFGMDEMLLMIFQHVDHVTVVTVLPFVSKQWNRVAATIARPVKLAFTLSTDSSAPSTFEWNQFSDSYPHFYSLSSSLDITSPRIEAFEKAASKALVEELEVTFGSVVEPLLHGAWLFPHIRSLTVHVGLGTTDESDAILRLFSNVFPGLTSLEVADCEGRGGYPSDHTLAQYIKACPNLHPSAISSKVYHGIDGEVDYAKEGEFCQAIAEHRKEITSLSLHDCNGVISEDVLLIAESCLHVTDLDLSGECSAVVFEQDSVVEDLVKAWSVR